MTKTNTLKSTFRKSETIYLSIKMSNGFSLSKFNTSNLFFFSCPTILPLIFKTHCISLAGSIL